MLPVGDIKKNIKTSITMNSGLKQEEQVSYVVEISIQLKEYSKSNKTNSKHQIIFCSFYRNIQKIAARYHQEEDGINLISAIVCLNLGAFENEIKDFIVIGGDWNAHHSAWFDIDNEELDVHSDHLPITFNIKASWSSPEIKKQKIETWNLRSDKRNSYRQVLESKLDEWKKNLQFGIKMINSHWIALLILGPIAWRNQRIIWKGNKPWWSDSLHRKKPLYQIIVTI
ncbi:hypothetical protein RFI_30823 [Reticulomyxa filosa]|uniref:Endonuclease/exonuclease/phosphatase domain-containing protein n=1 Tax=Reticulomyxa filosa TaxID=46433 RepID=X6LX96_RETFI|nr:hypothetical protein RFI_30823 [Reticulomyxa filosa]|eukprot:ETO06568.1 hypothetical protein RFI_30823 [Reticulomyxa filosa]